MPRDIDTVSLVARDLTATDGAQVNGTPIILPELARMAVFSYVVTTTGTPTTYDMRVAVEGSVDGSTWFQLLRMTDLTNAVTGTRFCRLPFSAAATEVSAALSTLGSAAASATIVDGPWPKMLRGVSRLQTLTGGTSPHIISQFTMMGMDSA